MGATDFASISISRAALLLAAVVVAGCASAPPAPPPEPPPEPVAEVVEIPIIEAEPEPEPEPEPPPVHVPEPTVAVLLSNRTPAYEAVAVALGGHFSELSVYDLTDKSQPPQSAFRLINDSDTTAVVAIGLQAARAAVSLSRVPVIFAQVFNYQDFGLVTANSRGVSATAPPAAQLAAWQDVDPTLARVGMIIGTGHEDLIDEAKFAAADRGIDVYVEVATSDQETLYLFKRMVSDLDGFWLYPDNRVLSARVLKTIFDDARRRDVSVLVPNESLLAMGAALSVETVPENIAETITGIIAEIQAGRFADVPDMTPLSAIRVTINDAVVTPPVAQESAASEQGTAR